MTVIVAHDTPDAIRGLLKRWFIEPRPNVFVGTINRRTREKTLEYIRRNAAGLSYILICADRNCQGFTIEHHGDTNLRKGIRKSGIWLVAEDWVDPENQPF